MKRANQPQSLTPKPPALTRFGTFRLSWERAALEPAESYSEPPAEPPITRRSAYRRLGRTGRAAPRDSRLARLACAGGLGRPLSGTRLAGEQVPRLSSAPAFLSLVGARNRGL